MSFIHKSIADQIIWHGELDSTNNEAVRLAKQGAAEETIVAAKVQTGGHGRRGRNWVSEEGGAWFSIILRPNVSAEYIQRLSLVAALAASYAVNDWLDSPDENPAAVKWPNDIVVGGKKIAGILLESSVSSENVDYVVIGIGINALQKELPEEIRDTATSIAIIDGANGVETAGIIDSFHKFFMRGYQAFIRSTASEEDAAFYWSAFKRTYRLSSATLDSTVAITEGGETYTARALDVGDSGELIVELRDGAQKAVWAADVSLAYSESDSHCAQKTYNKGDSRCADKR
ncbi:MAG: biotin--[acetyl-CoA-carboxylase] ligase [Oscillospiraceae bacterium]|jgi:BirA family biotin operon repressor/biotin-[acetyl-CoA-carboxylase] ligase|nr:biotin--[acetyl-CoA-carboxylase] ligase [Oscillospiraceae bacterium]